MALSPVTIAELILLPTAPNDYPEFLNELKQRIRDSQLRASISVNRDLVLLYWNIGREILLRQGREQWGAKVIDRSAKDLKKAFPEIGLIICKTKNRVVAEYTLRNSTTPIGVSEYRLASALPAALAGSLPTIEELEKELGRKQE